MNEFDTNRLQIKASQIVDSHSVREKTNWTILWRKFTLELPTEK